MRLLRFLLLSVATAAVAVVAFVHLRPQAALGLALEAERSRSGLVRREIDLDDGLHYVWLEGGQAEPLVLLHGFGADKDNFTRIARLLTPHYRVLVPDHVGFGESSHPMDADYRAPAQAERLRRFTKALGIEHVHLGGSSMGGHIAMSWAAAHPDEVASLWLLNPGGVWSGPRSELAEIVEKTGRNPLMASTPEEFEGVFAFVMTDPPWIPGPFLRAMAEARIANAALEAKIFEDLRRDGVEDEVKGLATPALIVWGDGDRAIHVGTAEVLKSMMPRSRVIVQEGIGHLPMLESPDRTAADYLRFREELG